MNSQTLTDLAPLVAGFGYLAACIIAFPAGAGTDRRSNAATWLIILFALFLGAASTWLIIQWAQGAAA